MTHAESPSTGIVGTGLRDAARGWPRLDGVDALRGLAILLVLLNHVHMRLFLAHSQYAEGWPRQLVSSLVWNGQHGVQIFFAVSGFLITSMSLQRWGSLSQVNWREFYQLRFARIAPLLLLLLCVLSALHAAGVKAYVVSPTTGGLGQAWIAALTFRINVLEAQRGYLPGSWDILWSLSVEEVFYACFPIACLLLRRERWIVALLAVLVVLGPFARTTFAAGNEVWQEYSYLGGMDAIALGCLAALATSGRRLSPVVVRLLGIVGAGCSLIVLGGSTWLRGWGVVAAGLDMTILAAGTCLLIVAAAQTLWRGPVVLAPLLALGRHSYEVYLTHMFVVFTFFGLYRMAGMPVEEAPLLFAAVIVVAGLLGGRVARWYSEPMNRALRRQRA